MKITHPSMQRTRPVVGTSTQSPKSYIVEDATSNQSQERPMPEQVVPQELLNQPATQPAVEQKPAQNTNNVNMLESLLFLGRNTKEVEIGGIKFEISTLTQRESAELLKKLYAAEDGSDLFTIRSATLAYAIKKVNGINLEEVELSAEEELQFETGYDKKVAIIENMQKNVTEKIHESYLSLVEEGNNILDGDGVEQLKN